MYLYMFWIWIWIPQVKNYNGEGIWIGTKLYMDKASNDMKWIWIQ